MKNTNTTMSTSTNGVNFSKKLRSSQLMKLFEDGLKDMYWAEKALIDFIPDMIHSSICRELNETLSSYLKRIEVHIERLDQIFEMLGNDPVAVKCEAMSCLIVESSDIMKNYEIGAMCDAGIIFSCQKIVHYKIASYGSIRQFIETLGLHQVAAVLKKNLEEELLIDEKLTNVALLAVNVVASKLEYKN